MYHYLDYVKESKFFGTQNQLSLALVINFRNEDIVHNYNHFQHFVRAVKSYSSLNDKISGIGLLLQARQISLAHISLGLLPAVSDHIE